MGLRFSKMDLIKEVVYSEKDCFLFLNQPSQVYFPENSTADEDMDVQTVTKVFEFF